MATKHQIIRGIRKKKLHKCRTVALLGRPQLRGSCEKVLVTSPKKPNSANRKIAKVKLTTNRIITVCIPGEDHSLSKHSEVLIRGGRCRDVPGLKYRILRGVYDCSEVSDRSTSRSKYGCKKN